MKEQLIQYVRLLFAGSDGAEDIQEEILQNTLDRYDDLIAQGKSPEAAYRLAISGIGDISEIMSAAESRNVPEIPAPIMQSQDAAPSNAKTLRAIGVCLYITCVVPLFLLGNEIGLCFMFLFIGVATALMVISGNNKPESNPEIIPAASAEAHETKNPLRKSIHSVVFALGLAAYFVVSFLTAAWHITWVIFLLISAVNGLIDAIVDFKEEK